MSESQTSEINLPFVSVVVPCCNEREYLRSFIDSIQRQDYPSELLEILVADGRSDDGTRERLEQFAREIPNLEVIDNPGKIASTGLNAAIRRARGEVIIRADVHSEYASDYITQCVRTQQTVKADNVGGPWVARGNGYLGKAICGVFQSAFGSGGARSRRLRYEGEVDTVYLGCWPRETFERFGLFDEALVRNQDDEHNLRIIRGGGRIWQSPKIFSQYHTRSNLSALAKQNFQYGFWKIAILRKYLIPASPRHLVPASWILSMAVLTAWLMAASIFRKLPGESIAWILLLADLGLYALASLVSSVIVTKSLGWKFLPVLPLVYLVYHLSYALGFLWGLVYWTIRAPDRTASSKLVSGLSR